MRSGSKSAALSRANSQLSSLLPTDVRLRRERVRQKIRSVGYIIILAAAAAALLLVATT